MQPNVMNHEMASSFQPCLVDGSLAADCDGGVVDLRDGFAGALDRGQDRVLFPVNVRLDQQSV